MTALLPDDLRPALGALWNGYVVLLHATLFLAGTWLALPVARRMGPAARAATHAAGLVGMLAVTALCWLPIGWWARIIIAPASAPLVHIGAVATASSPGASAPGAGLLVALLVAWVAGGAIVLARLATGWLVMRRVARRAAVVTDPAWTAALREACLTMGTGQVVELRRSAEVAAPLAWGVLDPVIVLPASADAWTPEQRRLVLLHELAHVSRWDGLVQLLARLALAWYWFHPGAWAAMRGLHVAREEACDRRVLEVGARRSAYAECLIAMGDLARLEARHAGHVASLAMAREGTLHRRIRGVLEAEPRAPRRFARAGRILPAIATLLALFWVATLGSVRLAPQRAVLWDALADVDWSRRAYAASVLSRSRYPAVRAELLARVGDDPHPVVRRLARRAP